ncbi:MAG: hypothetical protein AAFR63_04040 [Cyanobacteria bacterium J06631_6]
MSKIASILYKHTPEGVLEIFETLELSVTKHLLETLAPETGDFFSQAGGKEAGRKRKINT